MRNGVPEWSKIVEDIKAFNNLYNTLKSWGKLPKDKLLETLIRPRAGLKVIDDIAYGEGPSYPTHLAKDLDHG